MSVLEILSEEFLAELPDDAPTAFGMILRRAETYVAEALSKVDSSERSSWYGYEAAQHTTMNTIIAAARRFDIEPFANMAVPARKDFSSEQFDEFKADLDHYAVQLLLDNSIRGKRDAILIESKLKGRLRQHLYGIRTLIDQADMPEPRRAALHKKISDFEAALDKQRVNVALLAGLMVGILAAGANVTAIADSPAMAKLVSNVMSAMGQAKAADDEKRDLPPIEPPRIALPPRPPESPRGPRETFSADLDGEIPF